MNKEELLGLKLYTVISGITKLPCTVEGKYILLYTEKSKASLFVQRENTLVKASHPGNPAKLCLITNTEKFLTELVYLGYSLFLLNGSGKIQNFKEILGIDFVAVEKCTEVYASYIDYLRMSTSAHIGKVKSEKIDNMWRYFKQDDIRPIKDDFLHKQKVMTRYYELEKITAPHKNSMPSSGVINREMLEKNEDSKTFKQSDIDVNSDVTQSTETNSFSPAEAQTVKKRRPLVATIEFILFFLFMLAFAGFKSDNDIRYMYGTAIGMVMYLSLGIAMLARYIKGALWANIAVLFIVIAVGELYVNTDVSFIVIVSFIILLFLGLFIRANIKAKQIK